MIKLIFHRDDQGNIDGFIVKGHAAFAPRGKDIVCAAVSALTQTAVMGIEKVVGIKPKVIRSARGYLKCRLPGELTAAQLRDAHLLLKVMAMGLEETARNYPQYIKIVDGGER